MNSDFLVGKVIENRYEILERVGSGGMATVYKAKCRVLNRFVAIKVLKDSLKHDGEVVKKFNTESRAAARLSHPNIVQVYDVGEGGDLDYIVMEYVDGITLKEYINKNGKLPFEEAANYAAQIGRAIECAHANHVIHRDIKPHNVLITKDGTLKVADFGIAQAASGETVVAGSCGIGSVHYISPEQARGGYTDERSDIYSLGVVLYEMLTGTVPFDGVNAVAIALMKLEQEAKDCRIINPDIPNDIAKIAMKAISKEQHSRYQTASEMVADLERVANIGVTQSESVDVRYDTKRISERETRAEYEMRRKAKKKNNGAKYGVLAIVFAILLGVITFFAMGGGAREYQVPDLTDMTLEEAELALLEAQLELSEKVEFEMSDEFEEGHIIRQTPGINQFVKKGRKIKVTVSSGNEEGEIKIPDLENRRIEDAKKMLSDEGLEYKEVEKYSDIIELGYVISQSPEAGTKVTKGSTVIIYVSAEVEDPDEKTAVPNLMGYTKEQAKSQIESAGFVLGTVSEEESTAQVGTVISQSPAARAELEKGGKVNIVLSSGKTEAQVTPAPTPAQLKKKTLTITIPDDANDTVHIKVIANGKQIYDHSHAKAEKTVDIPVQASKDASVQVYIDGTLVVDRMIEFD